MNRGHVQETSMRLAGEVAVITGSTREIGRGSDFGGE
jgi:hypothetical protein